MTQTVTATSDLDLSSCDKEPIRTPGSIQPHGFLLSFSDRHHVLQASDNLEQLIGVAAEQAVGKPLDAVIGDAAAGALLRELETADIGQRPSYLCTLGIGPQHHFDVLAHRYDGLLILEF